MNGMVFEFRKAVIFSRAILSFLYATDFHRIKIPCIRGIKRRWWNVHSVQLNKKGSGYTEACHMAIGLAAMRILL